MPITHRDPETVTTSAGRAPAGQSSIFLLRLEGEQYCIHIIKNRKRLVLLEDLSSDPGPTSDDLVWTLAILLHY